jgi:hypothetical protein
MLFGLAIRFSSAWRRRYGNYEVPAPIDEKTAIGNGWPLTQVVQPTGVRAQVGALA